MRLRATAPPNHVWSYDFVLVRDACGGKISILTMIDEYTRKGLTIFCARLIGSIQVIEQLANATILKGTLRDNFLNGEIFYSLKEAQIIVGGGR
jgi:putative transposase